MGAGDKGKLSPPGTPGGGGGSREGGGGGGGTGGGNTPAPGSAPSPNPLSALEMTRLALFKMYNQAGLPPPPLRDLPAPEQQVKH